MRIKHHVTSEHSESGVRWLHGSRPVQFNRKGAKSFRTKRVQIMFYVGKKLLQTSSAVARFLSTTTKITTQNDMEIASV